MRAGARLTVLSFFAGIGYTDGKIDKYSGRPYTNGNKLPYSPEYTGNAGAELNLPMGGLGARVHQPHRCQLRRQDLVPSGAE